MKKSMKAPAKSASAASSAKKKNVEVEIVAPESTLLQPEKDLQQHSQKVVPMDDESLVVDDESLVVDDGSTTLGNKPPTLDITVDTLDDDLDEDISDDLDTDVDLDMDELDHNLHEHDEHDNTHTQAHKSSTRPQALARVSTSRDNLHLYLKEVSRFPMLQPDEEQALAQRVRDHGDTDAAFRLVSSHLRLVVKIAMDFQRRWMQNVLDLIQEGNVGLMRAVNKFDPDKGIKFSYYAAFWIKAYILKYIMNNWRMVKIGTTQVQRKLFFNLNKERQKLISQGFDPDAAMLSEKLGVSVDQIQEMDQRLGASDMSLDMQVNDASGGASRMDFLPALDAGVEDSIASNEIAALIQMHLESIIPKLNEKENYILQNRLLTDEPVTLREIGERYNVTRERVRQLEARLLEKLRQHLSNDIKDFSEEWINT